MKIQLLPKRNLSAALAVVAIGLSGCAGTKVLKDAQTYEATQPLASAVDPVMQATLDWVIVRGAPGTWAKNADWDEYLLRIENLSPEPIWVTSVNVVDSLGNTLSSARDRRTLVRASKKSVRRYKDAGIKVKAGTGTGVLLAAGAAATAVGVGAVVATVPAAFLGGASSLGTAGAVASGLVVLGPAIAIVGVVRGVNNHKVNKEIEQRQTTLPLELKIAGTQPLDLFFPLAPSPDHIVITYESVNGEQTLSIDTRHTLRDLHFNIKADQ